MKKKLLILWLSMTIVVTLCGSIEYISEKGFDGFLQMFNIVAESSGKTEQGKDTEPVREQDLGNSTLTLVAGGESYAIPEYRGSAYTEVNGNKPFFTSSEKLCTEPVEMYPELDSLGRCRSTLANICPELMPTEGREEIGMIKPSGWHTVKYPELIEDLYLYNRCHLIGFQLAGENANEKNLVTGTRYLNIVGMLDHENLIAKYVRKTGNHVMYRVTPVFAGNELVCRGVLMEGWSVEDGGKGVCFCIFAYNVQPGISIDYATGDNAPETEKTFEIPEAICELILQTP